jgi:RNA polymerase sigma-70 factor (ECF subfamily)
MIREVLVHEHRAAVLALCLAHTRNLHDAEDLVQDVFVRAFDKLDSLRDVAKARAWLLQIARRMCADHIRRRARPEPLAEAVAPAGEPREAGVARLLLAIAALPPDFRETITLYYLDGRDCAGVAASLGVSTAAVRQRLVRARLRLHELLAEAET